MIRVELRDRTNAVVKVLSGAKNAAYQVTLNGDGAGSFLIHRSDPDVAAYTMLTGGIDGYLVHLQRKGPLETIFTGRFVFVVEGLAAGLDQQEDASGWITVSGRGTLSLLEDRLCLPPGFATNVSFPVPTSQWQTYVETACGAIMAGELDRSNPRFALQLTHSVNTSTALATVKLRFDNLRLLHDYLVSNGPMDAQMVGLDYQASNRIGTDKSASITVQLGQQDSLLGFSMLRDSRAVKTYVVAQGTGEGINSLLAATVNAAQETAFRKREGFLDARQDDVAAQLLRRAQASINQVALPDVRITTQFIDSTHTQLYRDFSLGDTITLAVSPLTLSAPYRVVGFSVADTDAEVEEIHLDLNSMRLEYLLSLQKATALTTNSLNVLNRMPQGAPFNDSQAYPDSCDATHPFHFDLYLPSNLLRLNYGKLSFKLRAFRTYNNFSVTGTGAGSSHSHSHTHGSHSHSHSHSHTHGTHTHHNTPTTTGYNSLFNLSSSSALEVASGPSPGWTTDTTTPTADATADATATTPSADATTESSHTHPISSSSTIGIFEGAVATGVLVIINGVDRTAALGGGSGYTTDQTELEISQYLTLGAWNTIDLQPSGLGRIVGHLRVTGYIQSN